MLRTPPRDSWLTKAAHLRQKKALPTTNSLKRYISKLNSFILYHKSSTTMVYRLLSSPMKQKEKYHVRDWPEQRTSMASSRKMPTSWDNLEFLEGKNIRDDLKNNPSSTLDTTYQVPLPDPNQGLLKTQRYHSPDSSHWWYRSRSRDVHTMQGWWIQLGSCWHWVVPHWFGWWSRRRWVCLH